MNDRAFEGDLYPINAQSLEDLKKVLVFAPHPDDEVFGCGGTLCLLSGMGADIRVIVLSDGRSSGGNNIDELVKRRQQESREAARIIGYPEPIFWNLTDRMVRFHENLIQRVLEDVESFVPDIVFAPAATEMHPDHQSTSLVITEVLRRTKHPSILAFYEVSATLTPSAIVDITTVEDIKKRAMDCFRSQETYLSYAATVSHLNHYRAFSLGPKAVAAEAFLWIEHSHIGSLLDHCATHPFNRRRLLNVAIDPQDLPLVSVIIRSMDRPTLSEAIESVVRQTYPNIEILVVNATGGRHSKIGDEIGGMPIRLISSEKPLPRSNAANKGLYEAHGELLIFLDEDDVFYSHHIERLVTALHSHPSQRVAYAGVSVIDADGEQLLTYDYSWNYGYLLCTNFLPINAVLFHRSLVEAGCRFDEDLPVLEDWDFWIQVAQCSSFIHVPEISAVYRYGLSESKMAISEHPNHYRKWRKSIVKKWVDILGIDPMEEGLHWCVQQYDYFSQLSEILKKNIQTLSKERDDLRHEKDDLRHEKIELIREQEALKDINEAATIELAKLREALQKAELDIDQLKAGYQEILQQNDALNQTLQAITNSTSWRITMPLRKVARATGLRRRS